MAGDCTTDTCPVSQGFLNYRPTRPGNAVFLAGFALLVPVTLALGYRFKTPIFASVLTTGLLLEVLGFAGRLLLFDNVANKTCFALFLLGTVLGSTFIAASIFIILPHALSVYGARASSVQPKHIALVLSAVALVAAIVEIIGTVCVAFAVLEAPQNANILVTGLAIQTAGLVVFVAVHSWFTINLNGERSRLDPKHATVYRSARFKRFLLVTQAATVLLLGHTIYRIVETASGLDGPLAQSEAALVFVAVHSWFTINLNGERSRLDPKHATVYRSARFKRFLLVTQAATVLLLSHTIYRIVETASGLDRPLAQNEAAFMVVNGALPFVHLSVRQ
ncbi:Efflux pump himE like protein [Verticillium longisporum]|nr:Efflux pump himE like protein [Verticillium longisporum]